jgi:carbon starvation protein
MPVLWASLIFVPIMLAFVWVGNAYPFDVCALFGFSKEGAQGIWTIVLLVYCFFASTMPVWLLLQPRDYLNAYLLYAMMALGFLGVFVAHPTLHIDAFAGFSAVGRSGVSELLFPFLFVTVACGACSGFHALVASGTSAKQLDNEKSIRPIAYGGMLLEGVLAIIALIGVAGTYMSQKEYVSAVQTLEPVQMFASTIAGFCVTVFAKLGIAPETGKRIAESFMLLSVSAFLMTTVDAGTRLARFSWQELVACLPQRKSASTTNAQSASAEATADKPSTLYRIFHNMYVGTTIVCALAAALLLGNPKAAKSLWTIFASANQLLASLTLLTATLWFVRNKKPCWFTLVPMCFMLSVSSYALISIFTAAFGAGDWTRLGATGFLLLVAVALVLFTLSKVFGKREQ